MKIIVDAMGGDNAPMEVVKGAIDAVEQLKTDIILVGRGEDILRCIGKLGYDTLPDHVEIANASEVISADDMQAASVMRSKRDSSMSVALTLLKDGAGDAAVSAGSTGALLSGATLITKRIKGVRRAVLAPVLPSQKGGCVLLDAGANSECTSEYLLQFAYMGARYAEEVLHIQNPKVGLLNIGAESSKGTQLQKDTYTLLERESEENRLNFIGNVEGRDILNGDVDVIVSDGYSGNIALKSMEGMAVYITDNLKKMFYKNFKTKLGALLLKSEIEGFKKRIDYSEVGGTMLLGISKVVIKAHGSSNARAITSAIKQAYDAAGTHAIAKIAESIADIKINEKI